jgi:hypothetical protein
LGKKTYFTDTILIEVEFTTRKKAIQTGFEDTMSPFLVAITTSWAWNVSITRAESWTRKKVRNMKKYIKIDKWIELRIDDHDVQRDKPASKSRCDLLVSIVSDQCYWKTLPSLRWRTKLKKREKMKMKYLYYSFFASRPSTAVVVFLRQTVWHLPR